MGVLFIWAYIGIRLSSRFPSIAGTLVTISFVSVGVSPFMETTTSSGDAAVSEKNVGPASMKHRSYQQASHGL